MKVVFGFLHSAVTLVATDLFQDDPGALALLQMQVYQHRHEKINASILDPAPHWCLAAGCPVGKGCCVLPDGTVEISDSAGGTCADSARQSCLAPITTTTSTTTTTTDTRCMGVLATMGAYKFECSESFTDPGTGTVLTGCMMPNQIPDVLDGWKEVWRPFGAYCMSKDVIDPAFGRPQGTKRLENLGAAYNGRIMMPCTSGCPGYVAPDLSGLVPGKAGWDCADGDDCWCEAGGDPHVYKNFFNGRIEWHGWGNFLYASTADGNEAHVFQCIPARYAEKVDGLATGYNSGTVAGEKTWGEIKALSGVIAGKSFAVLDLNTVSRVLFGGAPGYNVRIGDECWRVFLTGASAIKADCATGKFISKSLRDGYSYTSDRSARVGYARIPEHNAGIATDEWEGRWFIETTDGSFRVFLSTYVLAALVKADKLEDKGVCANRQSPGLQIASDPHHGETLEYASWSFNEAEAKLICDVCKMGDPTKGQCKAPIQAPPELGTPEEACQTSGLSFSDARNHCSEFHGEWLQDCLYDYCTSGGDSRFVEETRDAEALEEAEGEGRQWCCVQTTTTTTARQAEVSAVDDPHLSTLHGNHIDLYDEDRHLLLTVPAGAHASNALLHVVGYTEKVGVRKNDLWIRRLAIGGKWLDGKKFAFKTSNADFGDASNYLVRQGHGLWVSPETLANTENKFVSVPVKFAQGAPQHDFEQSTGRRAELHAGPVTIHVKWAAAQKDGVDVNHLDFRATGLDNVTETIGGLLADEVAALVQK